MKTAVISKFAESEVGNLCWYMLEDGTRVNCSENILEKIWWQYIDSLNAAERQCVDHWTIFSFKQSQECEI